MNLARCQGDGARSCVWWTGHRGRCWGLKLNPEPDPGEVFWWRLTVTRNREFVGYSDVILYGTGAMAVWNHLHDMPFQGWARWALIACSLWLAVMAYRGFAVVEASLRWQQEQEESK